MSLKDVHVNIEVKQEERFVMNTVITRSQSKVLLSLLSLSLALRLGWVLLVDPEPVLIGGDGPFYLHLSEQLVQGRGLSYHDQPVAVVGPTYPLYLAAFRSLVGPDHAVLAARVGQAVIGSLMVVIIFGVGRRWAGTRVGLCAGGLLAVDLRFIAEAGSISTEMMLSSLLVLCLWVYLEAHEKQTTGLWFLVGMSLGVATLTRAVVQILPAVLLLHLWRLCPGRQIWRRGGFILLGFAVVICPWMVRNWYVFGQIKIAQGGAAHFWMGARGDGKAIGYKEMMEQVEPIRIGAGGIDRFNYVGSALEAVMDKPIIYINLRLRRLVEAYAQPYGTVAVGDVFGSRSLKTAMSMINPHDLRDLLSLPEFWTKLWIYLMHYGSIIFSLIYVSTNRRKWRHWLLLSIVIAYFSGVYSVLTIIPRYLFPIMPLFLLLASALIVDYIPRIAKVRV